jgi:tetratricopeptide (TPR) repeat protein
LHRHLDGLPVRAHGDSLGYRAGKFVRRHVVGVIAASAAVMALAASSVVSWTYYHQAASQRERAEARFNDVRQLARFVLFDFDSIISSGVTPARKAALEKATEYLNRLAQDREANTPLDRELVEGYLKVGDLYGNPFSANLGDAAAAKASYERALKLLNSTRRPDAVLLARTHAKLADLLYASGAARSAIASYTVARRLFESASNPDEANRLAHLTAMRHQALAHAGLGQNAEALDIYEDVLSGAEALQSDVRDRWIAGAEMRAGEVMARMGKVEAGLSRMRRALELYKRRAARAPDSGSEQRTVATNSALIGDILVLSGRYAEAAEYFRTALEVSETNARKDPLNEQFRRDVSFYLARRGDALAKSGNMENARALTRRALQLLKPLVQKERSSPVDRYQYAWILLTTPCLDLRDHATAMGYAKKLVEATDGEDPNHLNLLALAHARAGDYAHAIEIVTRALTLLPSETHSDLKDELSRNLADFRSAAATLQKKKS